MREGRRKKEMEEERKKGKKEGGERSLVRLKEGNKEGFGCKGRSGTRSARLVVVIGVMVKMV